MASCGSPVAALARIQDGKVVLDAQILSANGSELIEDRGRFDRGDTAGPEALARAMLDRSPSSIRSLFQT